MRVTEHFSVEEFAQPNRHGLPGQEYPAQWVSSRLLPLCQQLERIRAAVGGRSIRILSGFRSPDYNKAVGGAPRSQHMAGRAADITVPGLAAADLHHVVSSLLSKGELPLVKGCGVYPTFLHVDIRESASLVVWHGSGGG